jgi:DNA-binding transcriptional regulator YhcF (GntR family)
MGIRRLAETLGVNQNTVFKALKELEHEGYIFMEQGRGAFVSAAKRPTRIIDREAFEALVHGFIFRTQALGIPLENVVSAVISAGLQGSNTDVAMRGVIIEANMPTARRYAEDLERNLGIPFAPVLLADLQAGVLQCHNTVSEADLVVTPVVHRPEVEAALCENFSSHVSLYSLAMDQMVEVAVELGKLPPAAAVGVVCPSWEDARVMERSIVRALPGRPLSILKASTEDPCEVANVLGTANVLVLSAYAQELLAGKVPAATRIIPFPNNLDEAGIALLRQVVVNIRSRKLTARGARWR